MWLLWQQTVLIITAMLLLFVHIVSTYFFVQKQKLTSALLRLIGVSAFTSILWLATVVGFFVLLYENVVLGASREAIVEYTYVRTLGLPFNLPDVLPGMPEFFMQLSVRRTLAWLVLPLGLFILGLLVIYAERVLRKTRFAMDKHNRQFLSGIAAAMIALVMVLTWPRPLRNPEMPAVPLPNNLISVTYTHTQDEHAWPVTLLTTDATLNAQRSHYYSELMAVGWHRINGAEAGYDESSDDLALFSSEGNQKLLQVNYQHGPDVTITMRIDTKAELEALYTIPPTFDVPHADPTTIIP